MKQQLHILDEESISSCEINKKYFKYGIIQNIICPSFRSTLINTFPSGNFEEVHKELSNKQYKMYHRALVDENTAHMPCLSNLNPVWQKLYQDIRSDRYCQLLQDLLNINIANAQISASFWKYNATCFLSPHTDKPEKIVTHLIYFNETWNAGWGGCLHLHENTEEKAIFRTIVPCIDTSVILVTSPDSWHSVAQVTQGNHQRKSLQIVFWNK